MTAGTTHYPTGEQGNALCALETAMEKLLGCDTPGILGDVTWNSHIEEFAAPDAFGAMTPYIRYRVADLGLDITISYTHTEEA